MTEDDAGIESDKNDDMDEDADSSENDLYEQVKQKRAAKLAAKAEIYARLVLLVHWTWTLSAEILMRVELVAAAC